MARRSDVLVATFAPRELPTALASTTLRPVSVEAGASRAAPSGAHGAHRALSGAGGASRYWRWSALASGAVVVIAVLSTPASSRSASSRSASPSARVASGATAPPAPPTPPAKVAAPATYEPSMTSIVVNVRRRDVQVAPDAPDTFASGDRRGTPRGPSAAGDATAGDVAAAASVLERAKRESSL